MLVYSMTKLNIFRNMIGRNRQSSEESGKCTYVHNHNFCLSIVVLTSSSSSSWILGPSCRTQRCLVSDLSALSVQKKKATPASSDLQVSSVSVEPSEPNSKPSTKPVSGRGCAASNSSPRGAIVLSKNKTADPKSTPPKTVPPSPVVSPTSADVPSPVLIIDSPSDETTLDAGSLPFKFQACVEYTPRNSPMSCDLLLLLGKEIQSPESTVVRSFDSVCIVVL